MGERPGLQGILAALQELNKETDRGVVLVATSFLDKLLMDTLAAFFIENASAKALLSGFNAPFGSFSTRIAGCLAMGLITDHVVQQCDSLRKVRKRFAHEVEMNFSTDSVKALCNNLLVPRARQRWRRPKEIHVGSDDAFLLLCSTVLTKSASGG